VRCLLQFPLFILIIHTLSIVNVESEGTYAPERIPQEAIKIMREKLDVIKRAAEALRERAAMPVTDADVVMADI